MVFHLESWILGFVDGEGCFCVSFSKSAKLKTGLEVRPSFSVSQKKDSVRKNPSLALIEKFFECGSQRPFNSNGTQKYEVRNLQDLNTIIIPFFQENTLITQKQNDFVLFAQVCSLMKQNKHLSTEGLREIIELATAMNFSGKRTYSKTELLDILNKHS